MKKILLVVPALAACVTASNRAEAGGVPGCGPHGPAPAAPGCATAPAYPGQVVTAYRAELRTRVVNRAVSRVVTREVPETYTYTECVTVTVPQRQAVTAYQAVTRQVPYTWTEMVPVTVAQQQTRTAYRAVSRQVPYTWTETVPVTTVVKQLQSYTACVPERVTEVVQGSHSSTGTWRVTCTTSVTCSGTQAV